MTQFLGALVPDAATLGRLLCGLCCYPALRKLPSHWLEKGLPLGGGGIRGRGVRLGFPVALQKEPGKNDAEIVRRCQVEMERGRRDAHGAGETQRARERGKRLPYAHGH